MAPDNALDASDHDFISERVVQSVIHSINLSSNLSHSLYSGGPKGHGCTFVSVYNATLDPSNALKHSAHFNQCLQHKNLPYVVLIKNGSGPDHNLTHLRNILAAIGMFLVDGIDKLAFTRCSPLPSYLNICERAMSDLNIG
eukprot:4256207-Ditylum_brightwellii.AAC.2